MKQYKEGQFIMLKPHSGFGIEQGLLAHFKVAVRCDITNTIEKGTPKVHPSTTVRNWPKLSESTFLELWTLIKSLQQPEEHLKKKGATEFL